MGAVMNKPNKIEPKMVLLMNAEPEEGASISRILKDAGFAERTVASPAELKSKLQEDAFLAVILDIDSVAMDNPTIKKLATEFPATPFLCVSRERLHPELRESILSHIYACLTKPIDPDELRYWLKCIQEDDRKPVFG
jgi:DNA-binding NtrC family response regulator